MTLDLSFVYCLYLHYRGLGKSPLLVKWNKLCIISCSAVHHNTLWCNAHQKIQLMSQMVDANKQNLHPPIINCSVVHPNTLAGPNMTKMQCTPTDSTDESRYQCNQSKISNEPVLEAVLSNQNILTISWSISFDVTVLIPHIDWSSTHKDQT